MSAPTPSAEEIDDLLLSCRYGDLADVRAFVDAYGAQAAAEARDERGSTVLHMCAANGHAGASVSFPAQEQADSEQCRCSSLPPPAPPRFPPNNT
ncbi:hypothetical protein CALVIDRAFT_541064 [Calocera viscosa TUFC12733]|uniref:Ankyrin n=1 Tax=Calocera viscosa (strain TUFC12733) TaxID=1330018 RepID=A0A167I3D6_CALVF|nr:hypothetical protein CALVIDRAFT_541064 [Calocera viscosa TUFC12733]